MIEVLRRPVESALNSAVGVVDQSGHVLAGALPFPQAHVQCVESEIGAHAPGDLPAHDTAAEHVQDERGVDPAGVGANVGQIRDPELVRRGRFEAPLHQVQRPLRLRTVAERRAAGPIAADPLDPFLPHQPLDRAASHFHTLPIQFGVDLPRPVDRGSPCA